MGTREVYEEKLRRGNLHHDPTINPGLGCPRCPRCLSTLEPNSEKDEWAITPVLHDATAVAGAAIGAVLSAFYGLNTGIPYLQGRVKGPKWLPFLVGLPPLLMFSGASAAFGGMASLSVMRFHGLPSSVLLLTILPQVLHIMGYHFSLDISKRPTIPAFDKKDSDDF